MENEFNFSDEQIDYMVNLMVLGADIEDIRTEFGCDCYSDKWREWGAWYDKNKDKLHGKVKQIKWERKKAKLLKKDSFKGSFVYFIACDEMDIVKIGFASDPEQRLAGLQTAFPYPLRIAKTIDGDFEKEKELHEKFKDYRKSGEWFDFNNEIKHYINATN